MQVTHLFISVDLIFFPKNNLQSCIQYFKFLIVQHRVLSRPRCMFANIEKESVKNYAKKYMCLGISDIMLLTPSGSIKSLFSTRRNFAHGAVIFCQCFAAGKLKAVQLFSCTQNVAPRAKFRLVENGLKSLW